MGPSKRNIAYEKKISPQSDPRFDIKRIVSFSIPIDSARNWNLSRTRESRERNTTKQRFHCDLGTRGKWKKGEISRDPTEEASMFYIS